MASALIGALRVTLGLDTAAFEKGANAAQKKVRGLSRDLERQGKKWTDLGKKLSIGLTAPLLGFAGLSIKTASDAAELQSAFDQTFGKMSARMNAWAVQTGDAMGRSTQEMQEAANTFGIFFNQAAPTREQAAEMSKTFAVLAQDLSSFYNTDPGTAMEKLRSGLSGEAEPLRDFGVFLTEASVKAKAMELGLADANGEVSEQAKIMARYAIIMEKTKNAQGDVARTADGTANQMRRAKAAFEEAQVAIGTKLLPVITPLIEKLAVLLDKFAKLPDGVQTFILVAGGLGAVLGPAIAGIGGMISGFGTLLPLLVKLGPVITTVRVAMLALLTNPVILAAAGTIALIYAAWQNWDKIKPIIDRVGVAITAWWNVKVKPVLDAVGGAVGAAIGWFGKLYTGVKLWVQQKLGAVFDWLKGKLHAIGGWFFDLYDAVVGHSYVPDMVDGIAAEMKRLDGVMVDPARKATADTKEAFRAMAQDTQQLLDRLFPEIVKAQQYSRDLALIDASQLSDSDKGLARGRLAYENVGIDPKAPIALVAQMPNFAPDAETLKKLMGSVGDATARLGDKAKTQTVRIAESFKDMAEKTLSALSNMVDAIKGGGFLDILKGVIGLGMQLGSIGAFGKVIQARLRDVPGYAMGTINHPGGLAVVGERGPELLNLPRGSQVFGNETLRGIAGGLRIEVVANNNGFGAMVRNQAGQVVAEAAPGLMNGGAALAGSQALFNRSRRLA